MTAEATQISPVPDAPPAEAQSPVEPAESPVPEAPNGGVEQDLERLAPLTDKLTLSTGREVKINRLRAREFFKLLRVITRGGSNVLRGFSLDASDPEAFIGQLIALIVFAIPEADDEALDFIYAITEPTVPTSASDEEKKKIRAEYAAELDNPELEDFVSIVENVVRRESEDLQALGKRLQKLFKLAQKTGQLPKA